MHPLLRRQIRKHWGDAPLDPRLDRLLDAIDDAYAAADEDRVMLERAMDLASQELNERNEELATANDGLRRADEARRHFINTAAHELGTPLTPMRLQLYTLRKKSESDGRRQDVELLERNLERIITLVGDLLDSAKIQSGKLAMREQEFDAGRAIHAAAASFTDMARDQGIGLTVAGGPQLPVYMDEDRFHQILVNLLSNAMKFTPHGGHITITGSAEDQQAVITVEDDGVGIDPARLPELFQPFAQLHRHDDPTLSGTGLGLYISRGIAEAADGTLEAASDGLGHGARFTLRLPLVT